MKSFCISNQKHSFNETQNQFQKLGINLIKFTPNTNPQGKIFREGVGIQENIYLQNQLDILSYLYDNFDDDHFLITTDNTEVVRIDNLQRIIDNAPENWNVIFLGGMNHYHYPNVINNDFYQCHYSFNCHSYIVKRSFIPYMVYHIIKRDSEVDVIYARMQQKGVGKWYGLVDDIIIDKYNSHIKVFPESTISDKYENIPNNYRGLEYYFELISSKILLDNNYPKVLKKSKKKSIIIESRDVKNLEFTIRNTIQKLGNGWGHIVICSDENIKTIKKIKKDIPNIEIRLDNSIKNRKTYNDLFFDKLFWKSLKCEKVLIYQTDTFIFKDFKDEYLNYDYIGARWPEFVINDVKHYIEDHLEFGNGGLSIRDVKKMIEILDNPIESIFKNGKELYCDETGVNEDLFFSYHLHKDGNLPTIETVDDFSFEHMFNKDAFGCHQPWRSCNYNMFIDILINNGFKFKDILHIYIVTWNQKKIQYTLDWYRDRFNNCIFTIFDNQSPKEIIDIYKENGCNIKTFKTNDRFDDLTHQKIKNTCWKGQKEEWAICIDDDELLDIKMSDILFSDYDVFQFKGVERFERKYHVFCTTYDKGVLFKPGSVQDMDYSAGCHTMAPVGRKKLNISWYKKYLIHDKWSSYNDAIERNKRINEKLSTGSLLKNWCWHYGMDNRKYYNDGIEKGVEYNEISNCKTIDHSDYMPPTLHDIGLEKGTDKSTYHGYFKFYESYLDKYKINSLLEIGVLEGASLQTWRDWLPQESHIEGWDINKPIRVNGCTIKQVDQNNKEQLENASSMLYDVIIDDGSHSKLSIETSFGVMFKHSKIYIIEDLHAHFFNDIFYIKPDEEPTINILRRIYQGISDWYSEYNSQEEIDYINQNIEIVDIFFEGDLTSPRHCSISCIMINKENYNGGLRENLIKFEEQNISFFTSLNPMHRDPKIQYDAVISWKKHGNVYSLNTEKEIKKLEPVFPWINFVQCESEDSIKKYGKPIPKINSFFDAFRQVDSDYYTIINSDIIINSSKYNWIKYKRDLEDIVTISQRYDIKGEEIKAHFWGFDTFTLHKSHLDKLPNDENYVLGKPWWDYWFPKYFIENNIPIQINNTPIFYHIDHDKNWDDDDSKEFLEYFKHSFNIPKEEDLMDLKEVQKYRSEIFNFSKYIKFDGGIQPLDKNKIIDSKYFIYCSGKTGGTTIKETLKQISDTVIHTHGYHDFAVRYPHCKYSLLQNLDINLSKHKVIIIDSYRTPIERSISSFFQNMEYDKNFVPLSIREKVKKGNTKDVIDFFNTHLLLNESYHTYLDVTKYYGINSDFNFDKKTGYNKIVNGKLTIYKTRLQSSDKWTSMIREITGKDLKLTSSNLSKDKPYSNYYDQFKKEYKAPNKYFEHFKKCLSNDKFEPYDNRIRLDANEMIKMMDESEISDYIKKWENKVN